MRANIIGNFRKNTGLLEDAKLLTTLLRNVLGQLVTVSHVSHVYPHCSEGEVNFFIEVVNPSLMSYAKKNIWIPNVEWTYRSWEPYVLMFDEIWTKTPDATELFKKLTEGSSTKVVQIGWLSPDKTFQEKKNYSKAIVLVGKNIYRNPKNLLSAYLEIQKTEPKIYAKLPTLHIAYNPDRLTVDVPAELDTKIKVLASELSQKEYDELLAECGLAICISAAEGFGHAVNEALSSGCNVLLSSIEPFKSLTSHMTDAALFADIQGSGSSRECYGNFITTSVVGIVKCLKTYVSRDLGTRKSVSKIAREAYDKNNIEFIKTVVPLVNSLTSVDFYDLKSMFPKEAELPDVSIVTLTRDRRVFMPLAKYSYMIQSYPEDKLEWVVVDDGEDSIEDTLIGVPHVKYVQCEKDLTIGEKRNIGVQNAMYDIVVMMDDDDVYPNNSVLQRVAMMLKAPAKECGFCTGIPCYDIVKFSSYMNIPPYQLPMAQRVSEATLVFTKKFWEQGKFPEIHIAEGETFISGREQMCREISPQEVIVSLVHPKNTSSRRVPNLKEPNGCHYGFNENLFTLVTQIGKELSSEDQKECGPATGGESGGGGDGESGGLQQMTQPG
jgi:hypothetical protein